MICFWIKKAVPEEGGSRTAPIGEDDFLKLSKALKTLNIM